MQKLKKIILAPQNNLQNNKNQNIFCFTIQDRFKYSSLVCIFCIFLLPFNYTFAQEKIKGHGGPVKGLTISPDNKILVSTSFDYTSILWSIENMAELQTFNDHNAAVNIAKFSPDQKYLITVSDDTQVLLYDLEKTSFNSSNETKVIQLGRHTGKVSDANFSIDSKFLVTSGWDGKIMIWNLENMSLLLETSSGHRGPINAVQFSNDNNFIYSAGYDGTIRKYDLISEEIKQVIISNGWGINVFHIDESKEILVYGSTDGAIVIYDYANYEEILRIGEERIPVLSLTRNKSGSFIALGNSKGRVIIIETESFSLVRDFRAAYGPVWALALNNDGTMLFVGGLDDFINQWDLVTYPQPVIIPPGPARRFNPSKKISNGEKQFARKCSVCHTLVADSKRRAGPTLYKLFGRRAGSLQDYKYSDTLIQSEIVWNAESIHRLFTEGPDVVLPGTKMPIQRMKSSKDRVDLINFLKVATENNDLTQ